MELDRMLSQIDVEDFAAWGKGYADGHSFEMTGALRSNPYQKNTKSAEDWSEGFCAGIYAAHNYKRVRREILEANVNGK